MYRDTVKSLVILGGHIQLVVVAIIGKIPPRWIAIGASVACLVIGVRCVLADIFQPPINQTAYVYKR